MVPRLSHLGHSSKISISEIRQSFTQLSYLRTGITNGLIIAIASRYEDGRELASGSMNSFKILSNLLNEFLLVPATTRTTVIEF